MAKSVLARKTATARAQPPRAVKSTDYVPGAPRALGRAIRRAGMAYEALMAESRDETVQWDRSLAQVIEGLPDGGLLVILEGEDRARGVIHMHQGLLDALIEVQTTGAVDTVAGPNRAATRIDAALARDFIDLVLSAFAAELEEAGFGETLARLHFGTLLNDRKKIPLLMPEREYHVVKASLDLGEDGSRLGAFLLAVPWEPSALDFAERAKPDAEWRHQFHRALSLAVTPFDIVLFRTEITLAQVLAMQPGDEFPFDADLLSAVRIEDSLGRPVMRGRLGQVGGKRAVRIVLGATTRPEGDPVLPSPPADITEMDMGAPDPPNGGAGAVPGLPGLGAVEGSAEPHALDPGLGSGPAAGAAAARLPEPSIPPDPGRGALGLGADAVGAASAAEALPGTPQDGLPPLEVDGLPPLVPGGAPSPGADPVQPAPEDQAPQPPQPGLPGPG